MISCLSLYCFFVFGPPALALDPGAGVSHAPATSVQAYGAVNASCRSWTDGCTTCTRGDGDATAACSLPGIACTPGPIACAVP